MATQNNKLKFAVIDTETTGLSPSKHEVIEVGVIRFDQWFDESKTYAKEVASDVIKMHPRDLDAADPIALKINGYTKEKWKNSVPHKEGLERVRDLLTYSDQDNSVINDLILVGHNIHFDISFLIEMFRRHNVLFEMNKRAIDTYSVAVKSLGRENTKSFSLGGLCEYYNITHSDRHTALGDARATYELYKKLFNISEVS